jgi:hypothetical protein
MALVGKRASIAAVLVALSLSCSSALAKPIPPRAHCRAVSKIEYDAAKREYLLAGRGHTYLRTGPFWRRSYWYCAT